MASVAGGRATRWRGGGVVDLDGRVALVTGGARRLGRAFSLALAGRGMHLAVHYGSSSQDAEAVVAEIRAGGGPAEAFGGDLRDPDVALALPSRVVERCGRLDVLVNSAAVMDRLSVAETGVAQWDAILNLNLRAPFLLAQQAAPHSGEGWREDHQHRRPRWPGALAELCRPFGQQGRGGHADPGAGCGICSGNHGQRDCSGHRAGA